MRRFQGAREQAQIVRTALNGHPLQDVCNGSALLAHPLCMACQNAAASAGDTQQGGEV